MPCLGSDPGPGPCVAQVRATIAPGATVVEWYAGVGALGLSVAADAAMLQVAIVVTPAVMHVMHGADAPMLQVAIVVTPSVG